MILPVIKALSMMAFAGSSAMAIDVVELQGCSTRLKQGGLIRAALARFAFPYWIMRSLRSVFGRLVAFRGIS